MWIVALKLQVSSMLAFSSFTLTRNKNLLSPYQIISNSKNLGESKYFKFD